MTFPNMQGVYDHLIVHASATPPSMDVGASWIDREHRRRGFSMNGYHIVITRSGERQWHGTGHRTRPIGKAGAHVGGCGAGWNQRCLGVCLIGGVKEDGRTPEQNFTDAQYAELWAVIQEAVDAFGIPEDNVMGHRDLIKITKAAPKACPCFSVREWLHQYPSLEAYEQTDERLGFDWDRDSRPPVVEGKKLALRKTHTVKKGETLWGISRLTGVPLNEIMRLNKLSDPNIKVDQRLRLLN